MRFQEKLLSFQIWFLSSMQTSLLCRSMISIKSLVNPQQRQWRVQNPSYLHAKPCTGFLCDTIIPVTPKESPSRWQKLCTSGNLVWSSIREGLVDTLSPKLDTAAPWIQNGRKPLVCFSSALKERIILQILNWVTILVTVTGHFYEI